MLNAAFPCAAEAALIMISVTLVPHLASCIKGIFLYSVRNGTQPVGSKLH